jgi:hypothetical protein
MQREEEKQTDSRSESEMVGDKIGKKLSVIKGEIYSVGSSALGHEGRGGTISLRKTVGYGISQCSVNIFL